MATLKQLPAGVVCRRTAVIIPALNEAATLPAVISALKRWPFAAIRVVDNGSTDGTAKLATLNEAEVLTEASPGYGSACWAPAPSTTAGFWAP
jgi:hypothetical protein